MANKKSSKGKGKKGKKLQQKPVSKIETLKVSASDLLRR